MEGRCPSSALCLTRDGSGSHSTRGSRSLGRSSSPAAAVAAQPQKQQPSCRSSSPAAGAAAAAASSIGSPRLLSPQHCPWGLYSRGQVPWTPGAYAKTCQGRGRPCPWHGGYTVVPSPSGMQAHQPPDTTHHHMDTSSHGHIIIIKLQGAVVSSVLCIIFGWPSCV